MIIKLILSIVFFALAGFLNGVMDTLQFHYSTSVFSKKSKPFYWDPLVSWRNKYKNQDQNQGPRFPGSTTIFVWTTDAWHLFKSCMLACLRTSVILAASPWVVIANNQVHNIIAWLIIWIALGIVFSASFHLSYSVLLPLKNGVDKH